MIQQINYSNYITTLYHSDRYLDSYKKVIYTHSLKYEHSSEIYLEPFNSIIDLNNIDYYAYGLIFDIYNSKICPLDIDGENFDCIQSQCNILIQDSSINDIDVVLTSHRHYHIILGLKNYSSINTLLRSYDFLCAGFKNLSSQRGYCIIRTSPKYTSQGQKDHLRYLLGYRKEKDVIWICEKFINENKSKGINLRD
ncbi:MAG: hypothetical protein M0R17_03045 [Candidatus Omnitrophica bacterium]|nr:hypothetical protein [Candidatus Omnitrophota bacterium]